MIWRRVQQIIQSGIVVRRNYNSGSAGLVRRITVNSPKKGNQSSSSNQTDHAQNKNLESNSWNSTPSSVGSTRSTSETPPGKSEVEFSISRSTHRSGKNSLEASRISYDKFYHEFLLNNKPKIYGNDDPKSYADIDQMDLDVMKKAISVHNPELSTEQKAVLNTVMKGGNVFITGSAGTGKSLILRSIGPGLHRRNRKHQITAPTGMAAANIDGQTVHSWAGIGICDQGLYKMLYPIANNRINVWISIDTLIIDEISMLHAKVFQTLDRLARVGRNCDKPFGGLQIIVCGDFFQLPPVQPRRGTCYRCGCYLPDSDNTKYYDDPRGLDIPFTHYHETNEVPPSRWALCPGKSKEEPCNHPYNDHAVLAFHAPAWTEAKFQTMVLSTVYRQTDREWIKVLNKLKTGAYGKSEELYSTMKQLERPLPPIEGLSPTSIYCLRKPVEEENRRKYAGLTGKEFFYKAIDIGMKTGGANSQPVIMDEVERHKYEFFKHLQAPVNLALKKGAQVINLMNDFQRDIVNGSRGIVSSFEPLAISLAKVDQKLQAQLKSLNKTQSKSYSDDWSKCLSPPFKMSDHFGQTTWLLAQPDDTILGDQLLMVPFVEFHCHKNHTQLRDPMPIWPVVWVTVQEHPDGTKRILGRIQIPLALSWATTVHKSQGQTLNYAMVDIGKSFTTGQAYVGVSRCQRPQDMQIILGNKSLGEIFMTDPDVIRFYQRLEGTEAILGPLAKKGSTRCSRSVPLGESLV